MSEQLSPREQQQQIDLVEGLMAPQPTVIGLEGGPCSGKTTLSTALEMRASDMDRPVVVLPEAASEHIAWLAESGRTVGELAEHDRPAYMEFERGVLGTIISNIERAKAAQAGTDAIIVADRVDIGAYVDQIEYRRLLNGFGLRRPPMHDLVDRLIFLPSVASERPDLYHQLRDTNKARLEASAEEAAAVCAANLRAVCTHPELEVAWGGEFTAKVRRLADMALAPELEGEVKLGVVPSEARAFLEKAERNGNLLNSMTMVQSYRQLGDREFRLRRINAPDGAYQYFTVKTGEGALRHELQRRLSVEESQLLERVRLLGRGALVKQRYVVLDEPDDSGQRRLWYADNYLAPELDEWHFETEVENEAEARRVAVQYPTRWRVTESAKALILK